MTAGSLGGGDIYDIGAALGGDIYDSYHSWQKGGLQLVAEEAETPLTTIMVSTRPSQLFQFLKYSIHKSLQLGSDAIHNFWQTCFSHPRYSARFGRHFQDGVSKKLLILRDFGKEKKVKNCIYLLQLQQFIRPIFCCI